MIVYFSMKKRTNYVKVRRFSGYAYSFWILIIGILVFVLGVQFAYSQSGNTPFASSANPIPAGSPWHDASKIWCDNCITGNNLANNAVTSSKIADGAISDGDVGIGAGIFTRKINGANGWFFFVNVPNAGVDAPVPATGVGVMGMASWTNAVVDIICDSTPDYDLKDMNGAQYGVPSSTSPIYRNNHHILKLDSTYKEIYLASTDPNIHQRLEVKVGSGEILNFRKTNPNADVREPVSNKFECMIKVLSLCPGATTVGGPTDMSTCNV